MTQQDKELLLKDLCARLPYNVVIETHIIGSTAVDYTKRILTPDVIKGWNVINNIVLKPYLRPMSSMTPEEIAEFCNFPASIRESSCLIHIPNPKEYDWLNAHHFDFRNLIERGLAIDCTNLNIY